MEKKRKSTSEEDDVRTQIRKLQKQLREKDSNNYIEEYPGSSYWTQSSESDYSANHEATDSIPRNGCPVENNIEMGEVEDNIPPLQEDILRILGYDSVTTKTRESNIHKNVAEVWNVVLQGGLSSEVKNELTRKYLSFTNWPLMEAPRLNPEVKVFLTENIIQRDSRLAENQKRLCSSLTALGSAYHIF